MSWKKIIPGQRALLLGFLPVFVFYSFTLYLSPPQAYAASDNKLGLLGQTCQKMKKTGDGVRDTISDAVETVITGTLSTILTPAGGIIANDKIIGPAGDFIGGYTGDWAECEKYQKTLKDNLGCSGTMFYEATDDVDNSAKTGKWYTKGADYAACYAKAKAKLTSIVEKCKNMKHGNGNDGQLWKDCEKLQNQLGDALGCNKNMFKESSKKGYWETDPNSIKSCQGRVDAAGNVKVPGQRGTKGKTAAQVADDSGFSGAAGEGEGTGAKSQADCDTKLTSPLSWIICPIIDLGANTSDFVFKEIVTPLLKDVPISADENDPGYQAWQQFRMIGNIILVGTLLAVVYAQARGGR